MIKVGRSFKALLIFSMLLVSLLIIYAPLSSGGGLEDIFRCTGEFEIDYDYDAVMNNPVTPFDPPYEIPITISHKVIGPYAETIVDRYTSQNPELFARIHVKIVECPSWCKASFVPDFLVTNLSTEWSTTNTTLYLTVDENAPAFNKETLKIMLWGDSIGGKNIITIPESIKDVQILTGFAPIIKFSTPEGTSRLVQPGETAYFDVELENYGNGKTVVLSEAVNVPEGWTVEVLPSITLGSEKFGDNPKKTLRFSIHPPYSFGYHDDRQVIEYKLIPTYFNDSNISGEELKLSFIVQSRGFSTPGFEAFALFVVIIFFILIKKLKSKGDKI